ncbi:hypothetical protein SGPA1_20997 [Streptomyces misionensis JCM 4497]
MTSPRTSSAGPRRWRSPTTPRPHPRRTRWHDDRTAHHARTRADHQGTVGDRADRLRRGDAPAHRDTRHLPRHHGDRPRRRLPHHPQLRLPVQPHRLGLGPSGPGRRRRRHRPGADAGVRLGAGRWRGHRRADHHRQLPVAAVLPGLVDRDDRAGRIHHLGAVRGPQGRPDHLRLTLPGGAYTRRRGGATGHGVGRRHPAVVAQAPMRAGTRPARRRRPGRGLGGRGRRPDRAAGVGQLPAPGRP